MEKKSSKSRNNPEKMQKIRRKSGKNAENPKKPEKIWIFFDFLNFFLDFSCDTSMDLGPTVTDALEEHIDFTIG